MNSSPHSSGMEERYLRRLRRGLRRLPARERAAIVGEIAAHIAERVRGPKAGVADVLAGLGNPVALARAYLEDAEPARPRPVAPFDLPTAAMLAAVMAGLGRFAAPCAAALLGTCAMLFVAVAALKPIAPRSVGLWIGNDGFTCGFLAAPGPPAAEVLGLWIVPAALLAAWGAARAAVALIKRSGRRSPRRPGAVTFA